MGAPEQQHEAATTKLAERQPASLRELAPVPESQRPPSMLGATAGTPTRGPPFAS